MTLPKSLFEQFNEINKINESLTFNSHSKFIAELINQEKQYQKILKNSFMPAIALNAFSDINSSHRAYFDSINSSHKKLVDDLFRPAKFADSVLDNSTLKLFKQLSESPFKEFQKLAFPESPMDLFVSKQIKDFENRYRDSLKLFPREISSAIAISKMLGSAGVNAHYEEILKELETAKSDESIASESKIPWSEIRNLLLALLILLYQEYSSSQMEQRLGDKIDSKTQALSQQINNVEQLIQNLTKLNINPYKSAQYVVKDRSALVRGAPKNGSKVIAQIFPNQVVTIIDSEGKWIEVTYYDWLRHDYMNGWVLKKYLQRIKQAEMNPPAK